MQNTATRLSTALLGYFILVILLLTWNPFYFTLPDKFIFTFQSDLNNLVSNVLLFLPVGFFYRFATQRRGALLLGGAVSFVVEAVQMFLPARTPSIIDILANTAGAAAGAFLYIVLSTQITVTRGMIGRLRIETPLMGLVYLLVPLLWVNTLALGYAPNRWILTALIGTLGAIILSELFRHWWDFLDWRIVTYASLASGVWFIIGSRLGLHRMSSILITSLGVMFFTALLTILPRNKAERRFERPTLKKVFPIFILYLALLATWNPIRPLTSWHWSLGFTDNVTETSMQILFPRIEYLVAFTVLGYILAEWRGRSEIPLAKDLPRLFLSSAGIAFLLEILVGFQSGPGASLIKAVMAIVSALFGGTIYHLFRAHIRFLLNR
jgi:VanZ family protein